MPFLEDDVNQSSETIKGKEVRKSASSTNLKSPHDFQHHILDDVLEENEEEIGMKVKTFHVKLTLTTRFP